MARKISRWLSMNDLAKRARAGKRYQLSARQTGDGLFLFYREAGKFYWHQVANNRKDDQLSYSAGNVTGLLERVRPLSCPFEFWLEGVRYSNVSEPFTSLAPLTERFHVLEDLYSSMLLKLLDLQHEKPSVQDIADRILYNFRDFSDISKTLIHDIIHWPEEVPVFDDRPCALPKELPAVGKASE